MKHYLSFLSIILQIILLRSSSAQNFTSPCPRLFSYETKTIERDRYFGNARVETLEELNGVYLRLLFDKPCVQLGNWLGEVTTEDNKEFVIKKRKLGLKPGDFLTIRFYVKFTPGKEIPQLTQIKLNGRTVCPESNPPLHNIPTPITAEVPAESPSGVILEERNGNNTSGVVVTTVTTPITTVSTTTFKTPPSPYNLIQEIEIPAPTPSYGLVQETDDYGEFFQGDLSLVSSRPRQEECGTVIPPPNPTLSYTDSLYEGAFPWHAAIYLSKGTELTYICAASLISSRMLLTVAHCVTKRNSEIVIRPEHLLIYLGKYYLRRWSNPAIQERQVKEIIIHEQYDHMTTQNDIALLKLLKPAKISNYVRPVCLWRGNSQIENIVGESGMVVGWGFNENGIVTNKLIKAYMPVVPTETCINSYPEFFSHFTSSKSFCAGFSNGTTVCNGDSGGGMVFPRRFPGVNRVLYHLRGVVSISVALQNEFKCDSEHYAIFTDVSKYIPWIDNFRRN